MRGKGLTQRKGGGVGKEERRSVRDWSREIEELALKISLQIKCAGEKIIERYGY